MAEVKVQITGDNSDFLKKVAESRRKAREFVKSVTGKDRGSSGGEDIFDKPAKSAGRFKKLLAGGLGVSAAIAGFKLFGKTVDVVMQRARQQAALTQAALSKAFSSTVGFNVDQPQFQITSRDQAVRLGREAQADLNRVRADLERNFGRFVENDAIAGGIERALTALSRLGLAEDELFRFRNLKEQEKSLERQVDTYKTIVDSLTEANRLTKRLREQGLLPDDGLSDAERARRFVNGFAAPVPRAQGIVPEDTPTLADLLGRNTPLQLANSLPDIRDRSFSEVIDTKLFAELARSINDSGTVPFQKARTEVEFYTEALRLMIEQGVDPSSLAFQQMLGNLQAAEQRFGSIRAEIGLAQEVLNGFADIATDAFDRYILGANNAVSATERLKNIGRSLFSSVLRAGIGVGIGALTGNPIGFGASLGNVLGVVGRSAAPIRSDTLPGFSQIQETALAVEVIGETRIEGNDLVVTYRNANAARSGRGGSI